LGITEDDIVTSYLSDPQLQQPVDDPIAQEEGVPEVQIPEASTEPPFSFPDGYTDEFCPGTFKPMHPFHVAMATIMLTYHVSVEPYKAMVEAFGMLDDLSILHSLPKSLSTLLNHLDRQLAAPRLLSKKIPLDFTKIANNEKTQGRAYMFDEREIIKQTIENPSLKESMHFGWGELVDCKSELWHGRAWMETMRASARGGGKWPSYENGTPILYSDFVRYPSSQPAQQNQTSVGRLRGIACDSRAHSPTKGLLVGIVEPVVQVAQLPHVVKNECIATHKLKAQHFVLVEAPLSYIDITSVLHRENIICLGGPPPTLPRQDCDTESNDQTATQEDTASQCSSVSISARQKAFVKPEDSITSIVCIVNLERGNARSIRLRHPLRSELELMALGREYIIEKFLLNPNPVIVLPMVYFCDGFGVYR
jgi:hypothetical protein